MIRVDFGHVHVDGDAPTSWHEALLGVLATLTVRWGNVAKWTEVDVPILELAYHLHRWLSLSAAQRRKPFAFQSMESDEAEWLWFRPSGDSWTVGAGQTRLIDGVEFDDLKAAAQDFVDRVVREVPAAVGVDAWDVISRPS